MFEETTSNTSVSVRYTLLSGNATKVSGGNFSQHAHRYFKMIQYLIDKHNTNLFHAKL